MPTELVSNPPWCSGRNYCNASSPSKFWSLRRPPPHYWLLELDGFEGIYSWLNDTFVMRYDRYTTGYWPQCIWQSRQTEHPPESLQLFWEKDTLGDPHYAYMLVVQLIWPTISQRVSWVRNDFAPVVDWNDFDDLVMTEYERGPLFDGGADLLCRLHIGNYDRLPAHSCRGDYNGEWP